MAACRSALFKAMKGWFDESLSRASKIMSIRHADDDAGVPVMAVSYNIQKGIGADLVRRPERTLAVLREMGADIMVLQEADRRFGARLSALPIEQIRAHGWRPVPFETMAGSIGWHGNAVLVGERVTISDHAVLPIPALEPRGAVLADLGIDGAELRVIGMHLDLSGLRRRHQVQAILAHLVRHPGDPPVLAMGDLNEWRASARTLADFSGVLRMVPTGPSFHARLPMAALDRIFVSPGIGVADSGVHHSALASVASDHLPVWARLVLPR
jgi:endonuclease/exonuclease/phosphatase family metal-dependent hydrolase